MAKQCTGGHCPYGYGHHGEHVDAAKKGWRTRREGEAKYLSIGFRGYELHSHANGKVILRDTEDDSHFELSAREAQQVVREVKTDEENRQKQERLAERERRARERAEAAIKAKNAAAARRAIREAERAKRDQERLERDYQRMADRENREILYSAVREVVGKTGIKNYKKDANGKHILQEDVWDNIPKSFRAKASDQNAQTPDEVASILSEDFPYLGIHTDSDLAQAFSNAKFRMAARKERMRKQQAA